MVLACSSALSADELFAAGYQSVHDERCFCAVLVSSVSSEVDLLSLLDAGQLSRALLYRVQSLLRGFVASKCINVLAQYSQKRAYFSNLVMEALFWPILSCDPTE